MVNARLLIEGKLEGIGYFAFETLKRITSEHPEVDFIFLFDREPHPAFVGVPNIQVVTLFPQARHPFLWYLWFEWSCKWAIKKYQPDVYFSPEGYLPTNVNCKTINVMHDIAYEHYPETVPALVMKYYKHYFPLFAKQADRVCTVSDFSKKDLIDYYGLSSNKIDLVYNGYNPKFYPATEDEIKEVKLKYTQGEDYFVFIGGLYPRKNLIKLVEAFEEYKETNHSHSNQKLVLIGRDVFETDKIKAKANQSPYKGDIIFTGRINDFSEVRALISGALAMTYISIFEGFGIPCLEAFACGTPVIASNTSSLPEVCGDAAILVNPNDINNISQAMHIVSTDIAKRKDMIHKGFDRCKQFSWDNSAKLLWTSIYNTYNQS